MAKLNYWNGAEWVELGAGIISSDSEPTAAPGAIWLDTSDTLYQGTVFEQLENSINGVLNSKGAANGIATLDGTGNVPVGQLGNVPSSEVPFDFDNFYNKKGHTYKTLFDTPTAGDITEEIRNTISNDLVASIITKFDTPSAGQIQETLYVAEDDVTVRKTTTFNIDGSIDEAITEVI